MSTLLGQSDSRALNSEGDLASYFQAFSKPPEKVRIGLEAEFFAVERKTGRALPYEGELSIHAILKELRTRFAYEPVLESGNIIALKREEWIISLEPGGQMELSAPPVANVFEIEKQLKRFFGELLSLNDRFPEAAWLAVGMQPFSALEEITWVPKKRYQLMREYLSTRGTMSHEMMKRTATNQICLDYTSEENAMDGLRLTLGLTSIVSAMFAHSPFSDGRPNGFLTRRLDIWNHTGPDRSGLIVPFTRPGMTFRDYLNYLLEMPLMFIVRRGEWIPVENLSFRSFIRDGHQGRKATLADFDLHLSTAFPEVRLKQYLEIRGADCQRPDLIPSLAAFWKGILYDNKAREKAWQLVAFASEDQRLALHRAVPREGLKAILGGRPILPIARQLVDLSRASLAGQKAKPDAADECVYLERLQNEIMIPGKSPAERLLEKWEREWKGDPGQLIETLRIKPDGL